METGYGSDQRRRLGFEHGGSAANGLNWFVTGNWMKENGWREHSPSETRQLFAKLGWSGERTDLAAALGWADNTLTGNGRKTPACWRATTAACTPSQTKPTTAAPG